ncbi:MAG: hypothetical protein KYX69_11460 [Sphingomonas sp.]|uniref:hypothetical protein n=1 Tax=Sphingomonas sp. TaxID=28214 RepID=UPI00261C1BCD|nr:hypothetical protein [Sphingomonas sp.]MDK2768322.1 hypothetical protein [Sphingomonas sp.]
MPIGGFAALFALLVLSTLASGYLALFRANAIARDLETPERDITPGKTRPPGQRVTRRAGRFALAWFVLSNIALATFLLLYITGTIDPGWTRNDPTVQRP